MGTSAELQRIIEELERKLHESREAMRALGSGGIDAVAHESASPPILLRAARDRVHTDEPLLRALFDGATDAMLIADDSGAYIDANRAACAFFGLEKDHVVGRRAADIVVSDPAGSTPGDPFPTRENLHGDVSLMRSDGLRRDIETTMVHDVLAGCHLSVLRDVTDRNSASQALRQTEQRLRTVISNAPIVLFAFDHHGIYTLYEGKGVDLLRRPSEDRVGRSVFESFGKLTGGEAAIRRALAGEVVRWEGETRGGFYEALLLPELDSSGAVVSVTGLGIDVDSRKVAESKLKASEERYRRMIENTSEGVWMYDGSGVTMFVNPRMATLLGYTVDEMIGQPIFAFMDDSMLAEAHSRLARRRSGLEERGQFRLRRRDGSKLWLSLHANPMFDALGQFESSLALATDITEQLEAETAFEKSKDHLRQAQKMEAIGSLAGGVAHDFNNLLSVILSYTDLILDDLGPGDPLRVDLAEIHQAGVRASVLTRQLLAFSRQQVLAPAVIELNDVVKGVEKMMARLVGEDIQLSWSTSAEPAKIHADPGQIEQVIMNLVINARDAMPNGGHVTIETAHVVVHENDSEHADVLPGRYVTLTVSDTGVGMDAATRDRVFEPFFTTKDKTRGTGLGLSTVYGIVKQSGGHVWVRSELGKGTTFEVYLPRTDRALLVSQPPVASMDASIEGTETILVVEDEEQVRVILKSILRKRGYRILEAQNGGEAFLICEQYAGEIQLLLTDVVMPRMSGRQLAERLIGIRPDLKVLFVSGYTDNAMQYGIDAGVEFLQKPILPGPLLRKVRDVLDSRRGPNSRQP